MLNISFSDADRSKYAAQFSSVTISMWGTVATTGAQSTGKYMELWLYITLTSGSRMSDYAQARQTNQTDTAQLSWTGTVTGLSRVWATAGCRGNRWGNITGSSVSIVFNK